MDLLQKRLDNGKQSLIAKSFINYWNGGCIADKLAKIIAVICGARGSIQRWPVATGIK